MYSLQPVLALVRAGLAGGQGRCLRRERCAEAFAEGTNERHAGWVGVGDVPAEQRGSGRNRGGRIPLFGPDLLTPRRSGRIQLQVAAGNQPALHGATVALLPEATLRYAEEKLRIAHLYGEHEVLRVGVLVPGPQRNRLIGGPEVLGPVQVVAHDSPVAAMHSELAGE